MHLLAFWLTCALAPSLGFALPALNARQAVTPLSDAEIAAVTPYAWYASAAYCNPNKTIEWDCGARCDANPTFIPVASGGDGIVVQFWYVGYDPTLKTVVVGHQGTDPSRIIPLVTDADIPMIPLNPLLFPGIGLAVTAHMGFADAQALSAKDVLKAVAKAIATHAATKVTVVGHSLGGAISQIDATFLQLHLPSVVTVTSTTFGMPRVGNEAFADYIDSHFPDFIHVNNKEDPIPVLPPRVIGFHHPSGEKHILDSGTWVACPGHDNTSPECSTGDVDNLTDGNLSNHNGPYGVVEMGAC